MKRKGMDRNQNRRTHVSAKNLPGELLEQVLAHVPFRDRCGELDLIACPQSAQYLLSVVRLREY